MLTIKDLELIGDLMDKKLFGFGKEVDGKFISFSKQIDEKFNDFAILMQNEFSNIYNRFDKVEARLDTKADKTDITRLEHKFEGRLERAEDDIRVIKTHLKLS